MAIWKRTILLLLCVILVVPMGACGKQKAVKEDIEIEIEAVTEVPQ